MEVAITKSAKINQKPVLQPTCELYRWFNYIKGAAGAHDELDRAARRSCEEYYSPRS
jgi:hypothetical protein